MAQRSASEAVLTAIYGALNVPSMTALATGGVHNGIPAQGTFPYVRLGDVTETREDCMGQPGKDVLVRVHVFDQGKSDLTIARILSKAWELLHYATYAVSGHTLVCSQVQQSFPAGTENLNGIETRHHTLEVMVTVRQVL